MVVRSLNLKVGEDKSFIDFSCLVRSYRLISERKDSKVVVNLQVKDDNGMYSCPLWIPPLSVCMTAKRLVSLEWRSVHVSSSSSSICNTEWIVCFVHDWIQFTIIMDDDQWFGDANVPCRICDHFDGSDTIFKCDDRLIHSQRSILTTVSQYFVALFSGSYKDEKDDFILLEDVSYEEILGFFMLIHREEYRITDTNVEVLLKLSDRFNVQCISFLCFSHLSQSSTLKDIIKLRLADMYLNSSCIDEIITKMTMCDKVCFEKYFDMLSERTQLKVLKKATYIMQEKMAKVSNVCSSNCRLRMNQVDILIEDDNDHRYVTYSDSYY